ncbi:MAG: hypothetical protein O2913_04655 [Chloroflexi bacterium]|nr:hypothetical protein [Chloroflexota bacterium]
MATETMIKAGIDRLVGSYSLWGIGLTNDPDTRELEMGSPNGWQFFDADSEESAKNVEEHFLSKGMAGNNEGRVGRAKFVYIYMGLQSPIDGIRSAQRFASSSKRMWMR